MTRGAYPQVTGGAYLQLEPERVDEVLLAGLAQSLAFITNLLATCGQLRAFAEITERVRTYPGPPAATAHAVIRDAGSVDGQTGCRVEPSSPKGSASHDR